MINSTKIIKANRKAFTLVELLVVIAIIAILVGLVVVVAGSMMQRSKSSKDMANHRTISAATWSFSVDNKGRLLHPRIYAHKLGEIEGWSTPEQIERMWMASEEDDGNVVTVDGKKVELQSAIMEGAAYPYIGDIMVYQSPIDPTIGNVSEFVSDNPSVTTARIRSYSLNGFVGVEWGADDYLGFRDDEMNLGQNGYWLATETPSQIPQPSSTICSIGEEDTGGMNLNGWILDPQYYNSGGETWHDYPAFWDEGFVNISYIDGSTGSINITSDSLKQSWQDDGHDGNTGGLKEYKDFRKVLLPGRIGNILDQ